MRRITVAMFSLLFSAAYAFPQSGKTPVEVPFEFVAHQIIVQVKIGGKGPFNMLIDTDTDPSAIDSATARELGLDVGTRGSVAAGGGTEKNVTYSTRLPAVEIGAVSARDVVAATIDLRKLAERIGKPIYGVLGYSFLKDRIIQIDYPNLKIRFFAESPYPRIELAPNTVNTIALPFHRDDGNLIIDSVFINNEKVRATLDTGSSSSFILTPEAVAILGLDEQAGEGKTSTSVGYNGEYGNKTGLLKSVRLGRFSAESVPATFWLPNTGHDKKTFQVNIGNAFFEDFILTFDFRGKIVVFERVD
ncbi:MAG: aspartyl protease family protein [Pyrinomonadaceae bacterium]